MIKLLALLLALIAAPAAATTYTLTVSTVGPTSPSSVAISSGGPTYTCPGTCAVVFATGTIVNLTETSASTAVFAGWTYANGCATNKRTCRVVMNADANVSATFNPLLALSLHGNGLGVVTSSGGLVNCSWLNGCARGATQTYSFKAGSTIVLTETEGSSSTFTGWTGDGGCGTASTCTFTLSGYKVIVATFSSTGPFTIAVNVRGHGSVRSSPSGINCGNGNAACAVEFSSGTSIALSTHAAAGYRFTGWANGGCNGLTPCVVVSSSVQQGLFGAESPSAFFYPQ